MNIREKREAGFTLLELLIVVSIIAILSVALLFVLNPAEAMKKARDAQRISDLSTLKSAIALYMTSTTTPYLGADTAGALNNTDCDATPTAATTLHYSIPSELVTITTANDGAIATIDAQSTTANYTLTDGSGWIPVAFDNLVGGSPISNLPIDPINSTDASPGPTEYAYRYACSITPLAFEIDTVLESDAYKAGGSDDKPVKDGGNNASYYEVGTNLKIIGATATF